MKRPRGAGGEKHGVGRGRVHTLGPSEEDGQHVGYGREQRPLQPEATRSVVSKAPSLIVQRTVQGGA